MLFVKMQDCLRCEQAVKGLIGLAKGNPGTSLDIYVSDSNGLDASIQSWATRLQVPVDLVARGVVTLNHDNGMLARLTDTTALPLVLRRRGEQYAQLTPVQLGVSF